MTPEPYQRDEGLAAERTELAWGRSAMSLFACGAAVFKGVPNVTGEGRPWAGLALLALGGAVWLTSIPLARARRATSTSARHPARAADLAPVAYGAAAVGIAAFVLAAFFPS